MKLLLTELLMKGYALDHVVTAGHKR
jgi:hypothetical protein